jgi:Tol biopolymer transport system component
MRRAALAAAAVLLAGVSAQAQSAADRVAAIASIRSANAASFSPDGAKVAFMSNASGSPQVWVAPAAGGTPVQVTKLPDPVQARSGRPTPTGWRSLWRPVAG